VVAVVAALVACGPPLERPADVSADLEKMQDARRPERLLARGKAYARLGDLVRAEQYLAAALDEGADVEATLPLLLRVCVASRKYRAAIDVAEPWLIKRPADQKLRFVVASLYSSIGETEQAKKLLEAIVDKTPDNAEVRFALGVLYRDEKNDPVNADRHFRAYLELAPQGPHAEEAKSSVMTRLR